MKKTNGFLDQGNVQIRNLLIIVCIIFIFTISSLLSITILMRQEKIMSDLTATNNYLLSINDKMPSLEHKYNLLNSEISSIQEWLSLHHILPLYIQETKTQNITLSSYRHEVKSLTFYQYSENMDFTYTGNYTFNREVYIIGFSANICQSTDQKYEILVLNENVRNWTSRLEWQNNPNRNPISPYDVKVYFWASLSTNHTENSIFILPENTGFYIPSGHIIHFQIFAKRVGTGGQLTIFYIEK